MWLSSIAVAVAYLKRVAHRIFSEDIFHLSLCPWHEGLIACGFSVESSRHSSDLSSDAYCVSLGRTKMVTNVTGPLVPFYMVPTCYYCQLYKYHKQ